MTSEHHAATGVNALAPQAVPIRPRLHQRTPTGFNLPAGAGSIEDVFPGDASAWRAALQPTFDSLQPDSKTISASICRHVVSTLARAPFNLDTLAAYQATALAAKDQLISRWNATQIYHTQRAPKRVYYFSLEFLMGRSLDNALLNLGSKEAYDESIKSLGFQMEDLLDSERDAGLGNGGLGRLAACYMDSLSTNNIPGWGYGLRYSYGIFMQALDAQGAQLEVPDPWLDHSNPWEIARLDMSVEIKFYGEATRGSQGGKGPGSWTGGLEVLGVPYDVPIPGFKTHNTNNIRFWQSKPKKAFDLASFNAGDYGKAVEEAQQAENITRVLYPNDNMLNGKVLRLQQQYFWVACSLNDLIRRFKKLGVPWSEFANYNAIQLNDTHPTLAIVEFMRILIDEENQGWDDAWAIVVATFSYTNHTVLPEALEKWPVPIMAHLLPRHMQLIFDINLYFLQSVERKYPGDRARLVRMSLIEEGYPQHVRMAYLAVIGSHKVNGVAELHSGLVKVMFHDFVDFFGKDHFTNVTNGVTTRRWVLQCNPSLAALITKTLGSDDWLLNSSLLQGLAQYATDPAFQQVWAKIKSANKLRLAKFIETSLGVRVNENALFNVMCKRIHEYKRQFMNILGTIYRYLQLRRMTPLERSNVVPHVSILAGKAAPGYYIAKLIIRLINAVSKTIQSDESMRDVLQVVFIPDYSVSIAELLIPASDISSHLSTAGLEASGTSNMKFCLNGGLLLGTQDGANIEIAEEVSEENVFFFGHLTPEVPALQRAHVAETSTYPNELMEAVDAIREGVFGEAGVFEPLLATLFEGKDFYLVSDDFVSYLDALKMVDEAYVNRPAWIEKTILTTARMGKFSADRAVMQYAEEIWNVEPLKVPVPRWERKPNHAPTTPTTA